MDNFEQTEKLWNEITETLSKLSYIAAGTISLSITFLGYVLSIGQSARYVLSSSLICDWPIIYLLFLSWILLFLSLFLGIMAKLPNAWYLFNSHINLWFTKLAEKTMQGDGKNYKLVSNSAKNSQERYWQISRCIRWLTIIFFMSGILALLIFVIMVANGLIRIY